MRLSDYGQQGLIGIGTPQANPTVEAELRILLPPACAMVVARLTSRSADPANRLREYLVEIERSLDQFDSLRPEVFGFCCTASSYLFEPGEEERIVAAGQERCGFPLVTASAAITWHLERSGVRRLALATPYPDWLGEAATRFWQSRGFQVVALAKIDSGSADTRSIYGLASSDAQGAAEALARLEVDAVLVSGTGMPSLRLIAEARDGPPLLSSNLCMAMALCAAISAPEPDPTAWRTRLSAASPLSPEGPEL